MEGVPLSRLLNGLAFVFVLSLFAGTANAQGFTLNPFTKKEPEPDSIRRSLSDTPPESKPASGFQFPTIPLPTLPAPTFPKMTMPQIPNPLGIPGLGGQQSMPNQPQKPGAFAQLNKNTQKFFKNTSDFVTAPFRSMSSSGTPARQVSSQNAIPRVGTSRITPPRRRTTDSPSSGGGLFDSLPTWLGGKPASDAPPSPRTVTDFLNQDRPN